MLKGFIYPFTCSSRSKGRSSSSSIDSPLLLKKSERGRPTTRRRKKKHYTEMKDVKEKDLLPRDER